MESRPDTKARAFLGKYEPYKKQLVLDEARKYKTCNSTLNPMRISLKGRWR